MLAGTLIVPRVGRKSAVFSSAVVFPVDPLGVILTEPFFRRREGSLANEALWMTLQRDPSPG